MVLQPPYNKSENVQLNVLIIYAPPVRVLGGRKFRIGRRFFCEGRAVAGASESISGKE